MLKKIKKKEISLLYEINDKCLTFSYLHLQFNLCSYIFIVCTNYLNLCDKL